MRHREAAAAPGQARVEIPRSPFVTRPALTLLEMIVALLLLGLILFIAVGWTRSVRLAARRELAFDALARLSDALDRFRRERGADPPESDDLSADAAVAALRQDAASRKIMSEIPAALWTQQRPLRLLDPWGTPLRYVGRARAPSRVAANNGWPIFVSAGPDHDFGDQRAAGLGDNIASDDPVVLDRAPARPATAPASRPARETTHALRLDEGVH